VPEQRFRAALVSGFSASSVFLPGRPPWRQIELQQVFQIHVEQFFREIAHFVVDGIAFVGGLAGGILTVLSSLRSRGWFLSILGILWNRDISQSPRSGLEQRQELLTVDASGPPATGGTVQAVIAGDDKYLSGAAVRTQQPFDLIVSRLRAGGEGHGEWPLGSRSRGLFLLVPTISIRCCVEHDNGVATDII
jgi:hypothetical protein